MNSHKTKCSQYLSYDASVRLRPQKGQYSLAVAIEGLGTDVRNKEFCLRSHLNSTLSLFYPSSQQSRISVECDKDVNFTSG
jgi:hypothetical protein